MENAITDIESIATEEVDVGLIQKFLEELPDKALHFGVRVLLAILLFSSCLLSFLSI